MNKLVIPTILVSITLVAGIFAFMPVEKASTVHTTIQGTQLNNIATTFDTDLASNATATCASGDFLVYFIFTNDTDLATADVTFTKLGITDDVPNGLDLSVTLALANQTSIAGTIGGVSGATLTFSSDPVNEESGDLGLTIICQSGQAPTLVP